MEFTLVKPAQEPRTSNDQWRISNEIYTLNLLRACWFLIPLEFFVGIIAGHMQASDLQVYVPGMVYVTLSKLVLIVILTFLLYRAFEKDWSTTTTAGRDIDVRRSEHWPWQRWLATSLVLWLMTYFIKLISMAAAYFLYIWEGNPVDVPLFGYDVSFYLLHRVFRSSFLISDKYHDSHWLFLSATLFHSFLACLILLSLRKRWRHYNDTAVIMRIASLAIALSIVHMFVFASGAYETTFEWIN